jgi:outer membrane protein assembly factor BamB|tara:strand:+ start:2550 stop:3923 length:1374 start_codon:yes stop_codon:yes gene_type:complete
MKRLILVIVTIVFTSCSLDNKTGIWKDASNLPVESQPGKSIDDNRPNTKYEDIFLKNKTFNETKIASKALNIKISDPVKIANWHEQFAVPTNNISNFSYSGNKILLTKSRKLSKLSSKKESSSRKVVFYKDNLISHDHKGKIFFYSMSIKKKIFEYNFYKKKFKNFNKEINLIINKNILYAADNLGYLYALNLDDQSILWAKNYGIPFRSNLKFINEQILVANQDNVIYSINSKTGEKNWKFATSLTFLKSDFENIFSLDLINKNIIFLNTSGELYSINYNTQKINWVLNFKNPSLSGDTELFLSQPPIIQNDNLIISTEKALLSYNTLTASKNWVLSAEPIFKPIITLNYTYVVLKNNLLICIENLKGNVVWSKNIFANIEKKKIKEKFETVVDFKIVNSKINIYSTSGFLLSYNINNGNLISQSRISKNGINSEIVFLENEMLFIDKDNKLLKFN